MIGLRASTVVGTLLIVGLKLLNLHFNIILSYMNSKELVSFSTPTESTEVPDDGGAKTKTTKTKTKTTNDFYVDESYLSVSKELNNLFASSKNKRKRKKRNNKEDDDDTPDPEYYFTPDDMYTMEPHVWRDWLDDRPIHGVGLPKKATVVADGSGLSMRIDFSNNNNSRPSHSAYFKSVYTDLDKYGAESHLREIKAYYLDWILRTDIVLPCVGYRFNSTDVPYADKRQEKFLRKRQEDLQDNPYYYYSINDENTATSIEKQNKMEKEQAMEKAKKNPFYVSQGSMMSSKNNNKISTNEISGSIMIWLDGTKSISLSDMLIAPFPKNNTNTTTDDTTTTTTTTTIVPTTTNSSQEILYRESAISYVVFNYLANCMKTEHNHFFNKPQNKFIAIDNDRCLTPTRISDARRIAPDIKERVKQWKRLIDQICDYSTTLIKVVEEIRSSSIPISQRLKAALAEDVLSKELLQSESETFDEIDQRFDILANRIDSCLSATSVGNEI